LRREAAEMETVRIPSVMFNTSSSWRGKSIGLVPTMGALHDGHMSLVRTCRDENDITVVSLFVNPSQFGPGEDLAAYPRDVEGDSQKLRDAGVDALFMPDAGSMYPEGFSTSVEVKALSGKLCGAFRPGHFGAVATVVAKLLNIVGPHRAYFGLKDYQQYLVIKRLVADLNMPVEIVGCRTMREPDGLAMSSRNRYLSPSERKAAPVIYRCLKQAEEKIASGLLRVEGIKGSMEACLRSEPSVTEVQYASAYDPETLEELTEINGRALLAVAVRIGKARLIDNQLIEG
jgi:pantoate--beta-alanine ligase